MTLAVTALLGLTLLLAPYFAALPDEPLWSSWLCAGTMLAALFAAVAARRGGTQLASPLSRPETAFLLLLALAFVSITVRLIIQHGTGYFGVMLRGWAILATQFILFALARRVATVPALRYGLVLAAVAGATVAAVVGVAEYAAHALAGQGTWRIFGTSTPDYTAGYFVLMLPVTLALIADLASAGGLTPLLRAAAVFILSLVALFQTIALLATSSRFGLGSLVVALAVFGFSLWRVRAWTFRARLLIPALIGVLVIGVAFARPVLARLHTLNDNSAAFRLWTWRGSVKMAFANPLFGTGIGTWPDLYPRYALTGFTRLAHNSYLQIADECGLPALFALLLTLSLLGLALVRGLAVRREEPPAVSPSPPSGPQRRSGRRAPAVAVSAPPAAAFRPADPRLLLCGLVGALAGGVTQNLIDSDWYVFFLGATFWTLAGLAAGIVTRPDEPLTRPVPAPTRLAIGAVAAALCALTATEGIAAAFAAQADALHTSDPAGAVSAYESARVWDPLNSHYPSDQGYKVSYQRNGDLAGAEVALRTAVALQPSSSNWQRLGNVLQIGNRPAEALAAYQEGLRAEPESVTLLLDLAQNSPPPRSLDYYRRLSALELTPVGTVRALGEVTEYRFAVADAAMGDALAKTDPAQAAAYYGRAAGGLESFASEGGSLNIEREAMSHSQPDPRLDSELRALYGHVLDSWIALTPSDAALPARRQKYLQIFDGVFQKSSQPGTT